MRVQSPEVDGYNPHVPGRPLITLDLDGVIARPLFGFNPGGRRLSMVAAGRRSLAWYLEPWRYSGRQPMPGAVEGVRLLNGLFDLAILSARSEASRGLTQAWLNRHLGIQPTVYLRPSWRETPAAFKARKVVELGAAAHFEDDATTATWLAQLVQAVFLVDWARNRWLSTPGVHRVRHVADAVPHVKGLLALPPAEVRFG